MGNETRVEGRQEAVRGEEGEKRGVEGRKETENMLRRRAVKLLLSLEKRRNKNITSKMDYHTTHHCALKCIFCK